MTVPLEKDWTAWLVWKGCQEKKPILSKKNMQIWLSIGRLHLSKTFGTMSLGQTKWRCLATMNRTMLHANHVPAGWWWWFELVLEIVWDHTSSTHWRHWVSLRLLCTLKIFSLLTAKLWLKMDMTGQRYHARQHIYNRMTEKDKNQGVTMT